jgi:hypothetical protein
LRFPQDSGPVRRDKFSRSARDGRRFGHNHAVGRPAPNTEPRQARRFNCAPRRCPGSGLSTPRFMTSLEPHLTASRKDHRDIVPNEVTYIDGPIAACRESTRLTIASAMVNDVRPALVNVLWTQPLSPVRRMSAHESRDLGDLIGRSKHGFVECPDPTDSSDRLPRLVEPSPDRTPKAKPWRPPLRGRCHATRWPPRSTHRRRPQPR